jgi:uncharacterized cupin superfamily protein
MWEARPESVSESEAHHLSNTGATPFEYIIIGERIKGDEVTYPPQAG